MNDFLTIISNKKRFRAACKGLSVKQLTLIANHLSEFIEKQSQDEEALAQITAKKKAEKEAILNAIADAGLTPADFFSSEPSNKEKKPRKRVAPKYRITDAQEIQHEWSGRGRTPKVFERYFNNGGSKDSCRI